MRRQRAGWRPDRLRELREGHGMTLEGAGERLREVTRAAGLSIPAANFQTLWQHEHGEVYPGPHYRRAYCLLYGVGESDLGLRHALPSEVASAVAPATDNGTSPSDVVERALSTITDDGAVALPDLATRITKAQLERRQGRTDGSRNTLLLVAGYAGSGKSEWARFVTELTGWALLDKDPLTRPLVESVLAALGGDPHDRHTELYRVHVRPLEYHCLLEVIYANIAAGISLVVTAPFVTELCDPAWTRRLVNHCTAHATDVVPVWITCDTDSMKEYIAFRSAARDAWKLRHWDEYVATLDLTLRPCLPHAVVDNTLGSAISLTDQARLALRRGSP